MESNALVALAAIALLQFAPQTAHAEYRIMERAPATHIVLMTQKCPRTPMFTPDANERVGYVIDGSNKTSGCWMERQGEIRFVFQASGSILYYPANKFRYIGPVAYDKKYGRN